VQAWRAALKIDPASKAALDGEAKSLIAARDDSSVISSLQGVKLPAPSLRTWKRSAYLAGVGWPKVTQNPLQSRTMNSRMP
jgi:hypothetical protein